MDLALPSSLLEATSASGSIPQKGVAIWGCAAPCLRLGGVGHLLRYSPLQQECFLIQMKGSAPS
jgi:hypothetical protein